jgi:hypothetical protein
MHAVDTLQNGISICLLNPIKFSTTKHLLFLRRNDREGNIVDELVTEVNEVGTLELLFGSIGRVVVTKDTRSLSVTTGNLEDDLATLVNDDLGRPDFDVNGVYLTRKDGKLVGAEVVSVGEVRTVLVVLGVGLAH